MSENKIFDMGDIERDFPEDAKYPNGEYLIICKDCGKSFIGHKRRMICKQCEKLAQGDNT